MRIFYIYSNCWGQCFVLTVDHNQRQQLPYIDDNGCRCLADSYGLGHKLKGAECKFNSIRISVFVEKQIKEYILYVGKMIEITKNLCVLELCVDDRQNVSPTKFVRSNLKLFVWFVLSCVRYAICVVKTEYIYIWSRVKSRVIWYTFASREVFERKFDFYISCFEVLKFCSFSVTVFGKICCS